MLAARAGRALDPTLAETARAGAAEILAALDVASVWDAAIAAEPGAPDYVDEAAIDGALQAMGAFADLKSSYTRGHSTGVAELASGAAAAAGPGRGGGRGGAARRLRARRRARGRVGGRVGEGRAVTDGEWEKVRQHAGFTERILARPPLLARLGALGSKDHERMDGTGYPNGWRRRRCRRARACWRPPTCTRRCARRARTGDRSRARRWRRRWRARRRRGGWIARRCARCWRRPGIASSADGGARPGDYPGGLSDRGGRGPAPGLARPDEQAGRRQAGDLGAQGRGVPDGRVREDRGDHARRRGDVRDEERDRRRGLAHPRARGRPARASLPARRSSFRHSRHTRRQSPSTCL